MSIQVIDLFEALKKSLQEGLAAGEFGPVGVILGPALPVARCGSEVSHAPLEFERSGVEWSCHCVDCIDGEYLHDGGLVMHDPRGYGEGPWQALDDYAAMHFDLLPEELLITTERDSNA